MTEDYLQFIWKHKRILKPHLFLSNGTEVSIVNFGNHNASLKGPDFKHGIIRYDGLTFYGHIEIHIKSSDWYLHKHDRDVHYNNVILHVVYEHDKEVYQNGVKLPVIELKELIDNDHWQKHKKYMQNANQIICENELTSVDTVFLDSMLTKALIQKLNDKVELVKSYISHDATPFYVFLAAAFGSNLNKYAFLELIRDVPHNQLIRFTCSQRYKLLMSESGILTSNSQEKNSMNQWHFKGTRPKNFPTVRIKQFAHLIDDFELEELVKISSPSQMIISIEKVFKKCNDKMNDDESILSRSFKNNLIINGVVPYLWYMSQLKEDEMYQEMAFSILNELAPENNSILKKWKPTEISIKNAYDTQGLIGLYRYYCCRKKCLSCEVGNKVLKN